MYYNLDNLRTMCDGDKEFEQAMIEVFVNTIPDSIKIFEEAHKIGDVDRINKEAHKIKTSVRMFSIKEIESSILKLEQFDFGSSSQEDLDSMINKILEVLRSVVQNLSVKELQL